MQLNTPGLFYFKWNGWQLGKQGDWLVNNDGDIYTVDAKSFKRTYRAVNQGRFVKSTPVWAVKAGASGKVATQEGSTRYKKGDWLVSNAEDGSDAYAISAAKFERMYERDD